MPQGKGTYGKKRGRPSENAPAGKKPAGKPLARTAPKAKPKTKPKPKQLGSGLASGKPAMPTGAGGKRVSGGPLKKSDIPKFKSKGPFKKSEATKRKKPA